MKRFLVRSFLCFTLALGIICSGTAAHGVDAISFNPVPVSIQASAAGGGVPVGTVVAWPVAANPSDADSWLECNGQSTSGYPELAAVVGAAVPDLQGKFLRGLGGNSAGLGVAQGDTIRNITGEHQFGQDTDTNGTSLRYPTGSFLYGSRWRDTSAGILSWSRSAPMNNWISIKFDASRQVPTANENRPVNMAVRYLIRARP